MDVDVRLELTAVARASRALAAVVVEAQRTPAESRLIRQLQLIDAATRWTCRKPASHT